MDPGAVRSLCRGAVRRRDGQQALSTSIRPPQIKRLKIDPPAPRSLRAHVCVVFLCLHGTRLPAELCARGPVRVRVRVGGGTGGRSVASVPDPGALSRRTSRRCPAACACEAWMSVCANATTSQRLDPFETGARAHNQVWPDLARTPSPQCRSCCCPNLARRSRRRIPSSYGRSTRRLRRWRPVSPPRGLPPSEPPAVRRASGEDGGLTPLAFSRSRVGFCETVDKKEKEERVRGMKKLNCTTHGCRELCVGQSDCVHPARYGSN